MQQAYPMALGIFLGLLISSGIAAVIMRNTVSESQAIVNSTQVASVVLSDR
ncbi:hypothetical protein H6F88_02750 [Oculatella sp. FACHB-28]|uniref:hypothetical protein n=1 Tax=Cyanophyceae TaxID=3028117 RepID=UPI0016832F58|nr:MULTISPECIES: hypothetical protein [Cyanophyceae]MBD1869272.1 hypothetical protein [Cyanobacteria bacterium FACHB-471]MBD1996994.1 hypothetical protein [Leptolyngbya sp. FACHB-541]MBD2054948.1 hypothetical protein [Oculatella sp. FACHB-28]MBD2068993.1 hypothetical protein [Leptolyngbya sp. FACHB-671]